MTTTEIRMEIAKKFNLDNPKDVRCYHCKNWGYNCGLCMNSVGESRCKLRRGSDRKITASYQFCRGFDYVGNGGK